MFPKAYQGKNHEIIGSHILSVLKAISMPQSTLGKDVMEKVDQVRPDVWYPIELLIEVMQRLFESTGAAGTRRLGRELFKASHAEEAKKHLHSARDLVYAFDQLYNQANRGKGIGGWKVLSFEPGRAELEKTTPHLCFLEEGIWLEAMKTLGIVASVTQPRCIHAGDDTCAFLVTSVVRDQRWTG